MMPTRQNPVTVGSAANLRSASAAIEAAVSAGDFPSLKAALTEVANGFAMAADGLNVIESRIRDVALLNTNDPQRRAPILVSSDRIIGPPLSILQGGTGETTATAAFIALLDGAIIPIVNGGTGQNAANPAFNALSPMTALGDVIYGGASGAGTRLAGNNTTTRKFLRQTGAAGPVSAAPAWDTLTAGDIPQPARGVAYNSAVQSIPDAANTAISFDTNVTDIGPIHSTVTNPTRFTAPVAGLYLAVGQVCFAASVAGTFRQIAIFYGGSIPTPLGITTIPPNAASTAINVTMPMMMAANDYIEFEAYQDSGGALNTVAAFTFGSLTYLGR